MGTNELQQIYELLARIDRMLSDVMAKQGLILQKKEETERAVMTTREALRLILRLSHLFAHMGFPPQIQEIVTKLNQAIFLVRSLYVSMMLLQSTTLYGQVMGMIGMMTAVSSLTGSILEGY